jgi:hypothetical protein
VVAIAFGAPPVTKMTLSIARIAMRPAQWVNVQTMKMPPFVTIALLTLFLKYLHGIKPPAPVYPLERMSILSGLWSLSWS